MVTMYMGSLRSLVTLHQHCKFVKLLSRCIVLNDNYGISVENGLSREQQSLAAWHATYKTGLTTSLSNTRLAIHLKNKNQAKFYQKIG